MGWDGMLPRRNCERCGKPLNQDGAHPAELYAGTFTGLCYVCERAGGYALETYRDGAKRISYPPHCPSWRRDREEYTAYEDCTECNGTGRHAISRDYSKGGSYPVQCKACSERYYSDKLRDRASNALSRLREKAQEHYENLLKANRIYGKARKGDAPPEIVEQCRTEAIDWYERAKVRLETIHERQAVWT